MYLIIFLSNIDSVRICQIHDFFVLLFAVYLFERMIVFGLEKYVSNSISFFVPLFAFYPFE